MSLEHRAFVEHSLVNRRAREFRADGARAGLGGDIGGDAGVVEEHGRDAAEAPLDVVDDVRVVIDEIVAEIEFVAIHMRGAARVKRAAQSGQIDVEPHLQ